MKIGTVLYDRVCDFCNTLICFTNSKLQKNEISFIAFESAKGRKKIDEFQLKNQKSLDYIQNDIAYFKLRAVLKICKQLQFPYNLIHFSKITPTFLLDFAYDFIAKRRLKLNTKKQCCNV